jgi:hypothetical protein
VYLERGIRNISSQFAARTFSVHAQYSRLALD